MDGIAQVQFLDDCVDVFRVGIHFIARRGLRGASVAATVVRDDTIAAREEEHHLSIPIVR